MTITDVFDRLGIPYLTTGHEHCRSGWCQTDCPECGLVGHYRLGFDTARPGRVSCWACGPKRLGDVLMSLSGQGWGEVGPLVRAVQASYSAQNKWDTTWAGGKYDPPETCDLKPVHKEYLKGRKFDWKQLQRYWGVRAVNPYQDKKDHKPYAWNLFVPITYRFEAVSFTTRTVRPDSKLRYLSARKDMEKIDHKSLLYGEDLVPGNTVVVHEGPFDVWRTGPGAVCTFGTAFAPAQVEKLSRYPVRVVCYDSTPEGQAAARKLCDRLEAFPGDTYNYVLEAKDAGEAGDDEIRQLRQLAGLAGYNTPSDRIKSRLSPDLPPGRG